MEIIHEVTLSQYAAKSAGGALKLGTRDSYGAEKIHVTRDETWAGLAVTATFRIGGTAVRTPLDGQDRMDVPQEATSEAGRGTIVFVGTDGEQQIITKNLNYSVDDHDDAGGDAPNPTPDVWTQFVAQTKDNADRAELSADSANAAAAAAGQDADSAQRDARTAQQQAAAAAVLAGQVQQAAGQVQTDRTAVQAAAEQAGSSAAAGEESAAQAAAHRTAAEAAAQAAEDSAEAAAISEGRAAGSARVSESWAVGGTGIRSGEDTDNARYYAQQAQTSADSIASSVSTAQSAAEDAESAAQKAQAAQTAAEDAAERAAAAADFDPADFATAAQGAKADTSVQSVNGVTPDPEGDVQIETGGDPLVGDTSEVTPAQVVAAIAAGRPIAIKWEDPDVTFNSGMLVGEDAVYLMFAGGLMEPYSLYTLVGNVTSGNWSFYNNTFNESGPEGPQGPVGPTMEYALNKSVTQIYHGNNIQSGTYNLTSNIEAGDILLVMLQREGSYWTNNTVLVPALGAQLLVQCNPRNNEGANIFNLVTFYNNRLTFGSWYCGFECTGSLAQNLCTAMAVYRLRYGLSEGAIQNVEGVKF